MAASVPTRVEHFILQHLHSLEHLETLLAVQREPDRWWTGAAVAESTGAPLHTAEAILEDLCSANLLNVRIASAVAYQYDPGSEEVASIVAELVDAVRHARTRVYTLITSGSTRALRDFADAFRLRGPDRG